MTPLQYILKASEVEAALSSGCHWMQVTDKPTTALREQCHNAGCYLVVTDDVETCAALPADGVVLTADGIAAVAAQVPEPTGIVLQRPRPITVAISEARRTLGEESPQFVGVIAETPEDAVAAAKAGADFIQVPQDHSSALLQAVRDRSFTTPVVALGTFTPDDVPALLDAGISGIACTLDDVPPVMIPLLLNADE